MKPLIAVLKVRFGSRLANHWLTKLTSISKFRVIVVACAWSQHGITYILSTWGSTNSSEELNNSYFVDEYGNVSFKQILKLKKSHFLL